MRRVDDMRVILRGSKSNEWTHINDGIRCERYGQLAKAASRFAKALRVNPHNVTALSHMASVTYGAGRYEQAEEYYARAAAADPKNIGVLHGMGLTLEKQHLYERALECFERVLEIDSSYTDSAVYAALCRGWLGDPESALVELDRIALENPDHADAHYCKSRVFARMGRTSESLASLDDARMAESRMSDALYEEGQDLARRKKHEKAVERYTRALYYNPKNTKALVAKGWTLDFAGLPTKDVFPFFEKALEADPHCTDALLNMGFIYDRTGMYRKAADCFDRILEYDAKNVRALYSKGVALYSLKEHAGAIFFCDAAIRLAPHDAKALCSMVWVLEHLKRHEDALRYCDMAVEADPGYAYAQSYRGKLLYVMGKYEEARRCYEAVLAADPQNKTAEYYYGKVVERIEADEKKRKMRRKKNGPD